MCRDRVTRGVRMQLLRVTAFAVACVLVPPPVAAVWNWGALFDFHNSAAGGGQPNFMVYATPTGLELHMAGGANTVNLPSDPGYYSIAIGPITKNVWYDFVYHVKWSSGS